MIRGKGLFINDLRLQTPEAWAEKLALVGAKWAALKVDAAMNTKWLVPVAAALRAKHIRVAAWQFVYADNPAGRADVAARDIATINPDAFFVDAEGPYNLPGTLDDRNARVYLNRLRSKVALLPLGLCSYRYPSVQPNFAWQTFLEFSDFHSPQVYWVGSHNSGFQLRKSIAELTALKKMPVIPVGAAYSEHGWKSAAPEIEEFMDTAEGLTDTVALWYADEMFSRTAFQFKGSTYADRDAWLATFAAAWGGVQTPPVEPPAPALSTDEKVGVLWGAALDHGWVLNP